MKAELEGTRFVAAVIPFSGVHSALCGALLYCSLEQIQRGPRWQGSVNLTGLIGGRLQLSLSASTRPHLHCIGAVQLLCLLKSNRLLGVTSS